LQASFYKKTELNLSASEMLCLTGLLPPLIGDLVPDNDPIWNLHQCLRDVVEFVMSKSVPENAHIMLKSMVEELNEECLNITKNSLKPKHNFLTHHPRIFHPLGAIIHLRSMQFETKHQDLKTTARASSSPVNIYYTIALKNKLTFYQRLLHKESILPRTIVGLGSDSQPSFCPHVNDTI